MARDGLLSLINVATMRGLEIGALNNPVITRDMGPVDYVDRASTEDLHKWYAADSAVEVSQIVRVDHVWGEQTLFECVGSQRYDYVVASHVIEHVPDLLGWLSEISAVVVEGGVVAFAVPDKRVTFDIIRRTSSEAEMVEACIARFRRPNSRQIFDHFMNHRDLASEPIASGRLSPSEAPSTQEAKSLMAFCKQAQAQGDYIDAHCWVFTPDTFLEALDLASRLQLLPFEIGAFHPTADDSNEFYVSLRRLPDVIGVDQQREAFLASRPADSKVSEDPLSQVGRLRREIADLRASTSWRVTAPLRAAITWFRRPWAT